MLLWMLTGAVGEIRAVGAFSDKSGEATRDRIHREWKATEVDGKGTGMKPVTAAT